MLFFMVKLILNEQKIKITQKLQGGNNGNPKFFKCIFSTGDSKESKQE